MTINNFSDLRRLTNDWLENYDSSEYFFNDHDEFIEKTTHNILYFIRDKFDFSWGNNMPTVTEFEFESLVAKGE